MKKLNFKKPEFSDEFKSDLNSLKESTKFGLALACPPLYFAGNTYLTDSSASRYVKMKNSFKSGLTALLASVCVSVALDIGVSLFTPPTTENFRTKTFNTSEITFYDIKQRAYNLDFFDRGFFPLVRTLDKDNYQSKVASTKFEGVIGQNPVLFRVQGDFKGKIDVNSLTDYDLALGVNRFIPVSSQDVVDTLINYDLELKLKEQ